MKNLRHILAQEGLIKKGSLTPLSREILETQFGKKSGRMLEVSTNAAYGGLEDGPGGVWVTIQKGGDDITASLDHWQEALQEAHKDIKDAERGY
jgi:hypothetical protein